MRGHAPVEVRSRYIGQWAGGFEVVEHTARGYRLRRLSDGAVLPVEFSPEEIHLQEP
jgi:hypothetical protein